MDSWSLIGELVDGLPPVLTTEDWTRRLRHAVALWPDGLLGTVLFECRLGPHEAQVDAGVGLFRGADVAGTEGAQTAFARSFSDRRAQSSILAWFSGSMVPRLAGLCACVSTGPSDASGVLCWPVATIYGDLAPAGSIARLAGPQREAARAMASQWVEVVRGTPLGAEEKSRIARCFRNLPAGAYMRAVGVILTKRPSAIRFCIAGLEARHVVGYLAAVGAPCDGEMVGDCVAEEGRGGYIGKRPALVHIDVGAEIECRVGLEYKVCEGWQRDGSLADSRLFRRLSDAGLCAPRKMDALVDWPAKLHVEHGSHGPSFSVRRVVDTIKISVASDGLTAKAYLMHRTRHLAPTRSNNWRWVQERGRCCLPCCW